MSFVPVFKTGRVYEWDAAKALLDESGIPTFGQQHSVTGLVEAMPSTPTPEPGVSFALLVPVARVHDAAELLRTAGFSVGTEPGVWHFNSNKRAQAWWRGLAILFLFAFALALAVEIAGLLGR